MACAKQSNIINTRSVAVIRRLGIKPNGPLIDRDFAGINVTAMDVPQETVDKIQHFAQKRQKAEEYYDEHPISPANFDAYNRKLDETLAELQAQVKSHEDELRKVRQ
jgi:hypothetical protein